MSAGPTDMSDVKPAAGADCVMLHPLGVEPSSELRAALSRHDIRTARARSAYAALADLSARVRSMRARRDHTPLVLLLVHPERLHEPGALVKACQRYVPSVVCWMYDPAGQPRLRAVTPGDVSRWSPGGMERLVAHPQAAGSRRAVHPGPGASGAGSDEPVLRLSGSGAELRSGPAAEALDGLAGGRMAGEASSRTFNQANRVVRQTLTDEELAMLLQDPATLSNPGGVSGMVGRAPRPPAGGR